MDDAGTNTKLGDLQKKHIKARSSMFALESDMKLLQARHELDRVTLKQQQLQLRLALSLASKFFVYSKNVALKNKELSLELQETRKNCGEIYQGYMDTNTRLQRLYKNYVTSQKAITVLGICLDNEHSTSQTLERTCAELEAELSSAKKNFQVYQSLAWSISGRYDKLHTDYAQQLVNADQKEQHLERFRSDLRSVVSQVQDTQDIAQIGLGDLQSGGEIRPLRYKQTMMKIGQSLDLVRLGVTELLVDMGLGLADEREVDGGGILEYAPGSVEDARRKLRVVVEASERNLGGGCDEVEDALFGFEEKTLLDITNVQSSTPCKATKTKGGSRKSKKNKAQWVDFCFVGFCYVLMVVIGRLLLKLIRAL